MDKCPICREEKVIIHTVTGERMCIECYWMQLKEKYPDLYKEIRKARRA